MAALNGKSWFRNNLEPYLAIIKQELAALASVTGQYTGKAATFATLPVVDQQGNAVTSGDWVILTADDIGTGTVNTPQYPGGIYTYNGTVYELVQENNDIGDILSSIIATPGEVDAGTATDKVLSVEQAATKYAKINGSATEGFLSAAGNTDTNEVLNANQFPSTPITVVEATSDWNAA